MVSMSSVNHEAGDVLEQKWDSRGHMAKMLKSLCGGEWGDHLSLSVLNEHLGLVTINES